MKAKFHGVAFAVTLLCLVLASCTKTIYIPMESTVHHADTLRQSTMRHDSIFIHDSIAVYQKGDTIFLEKYRDRFRYLTNTDTLYQSRVDSVRVLEPYPVETIREVNRLHWWQKTLIWIGVAFIAAIIALLVAFYRHARKNIP